MLDCPGGVCKKAKRRTHQLEIDYNGVKDVVTESKRSKNSKQIDPGEADNNVWAPLVPDLFRFLKDADAHGKTL